MPLIAYIFTDRDGSVPLWEAMLGGHESVKELLIDNGAELSAADPGFVACSAVEQNNLKLLKEIVQHGVDVTQPKENGITALHSAVCEGNIELVQFLLDQGTDVDKPDDKGWTPRAMAEQQGHEEIKNIFQTKGGGDDMVPLMRKPMHGNVTCIGIGKFQSEPNMPACVSQDSMPQPPSEELRWLDNHRRRRASTFHNSIFGTISAANRGKDESSYIKIKIKHIWCYESHAV